MIINSFAGTQVLQMATKIGHQSVLGPDAISRYFCEYCVCGLCVRASDTLGSLREFRAMYASFMKHDSVIFLLNLGCASLFPTMRAI